MSVPPLAESENVVFHRVVGAVAAQYTDRSVIARVVAALVAVERWQSRAGVDDDAVRVLLDVLWEFPTVGGATFESWHTRWRDDPLRREIEGLEEGLDAELVTRVQKAAVAVGASPVPLLSGLLHASEMVGDNMFAQVDHPRTLEHLHAVEAIMRREGIALPPATAFRDQGVDDFHGWGFKVDGATIDGWRALA